MSTHNIYFYGEIKNNCNFWMKKVYLKSCILTAAKDYKTCITMINPFMPNEIFYLRFLDRSISNRRGV